MQFARLCEALESARATSSRNAKVSAIGVALKEASAKDEDLQVAVRVALGDLARLGVGWRAVVGALTARLGHTNDAEVIAAMRKLGDLGAAAEVLISAAPSDAPLTPLELADVDELVRGLREATSRGHRGARLAGALSRASAVEAKYLIKALGGELRIGAAPGVVLLAIAEAFGAAADDVRRASGLVPDLAAVALLARDKHLDRATCAAGRPLAFMLASPIETIKSAIDWTQIVAEEKLDGVRAQIHVQKGETIIFGRGLERVTTAFPEIARAIKLDFDVILDGEILAITPEGRSRPFQALQMRLNRKEPSAELRELVPVRFIAFDVLLDRAEVLVDRPWSERRERLEAIAESLGASEAFGIQPAFPMSGPDTVDAAFDLARKNGNEGLVLKRVTAPYEAGRRGHAWLKVKKATATLDVVVTAAEQGHGKRAGVLSDYTFAVWSEGALVDVGKAYSGLTDPEIDELSRHFTERTTQTTGTRHIVTPDTVLEVGFDGIQRSDRHSSGFALRFPRILRIRSEKIIDEADTLETVAALFAAQIESGHREEPLVPPKTKTKKRAAIPASQLSLFGAAPNKKPED